MPHFFNGSLLDYNGNKTGMFVLPGLGTMQADASNYPTGLVRLLPEDKHVLEIGTDIQKFFESTDKYGKVLYDHTIVDDKIAWVVEVQFTDGKDKWYKSYWGTDDSVIISDSKPTTLSLGKVVWVAPGSLKEYKESPATGDVSKEQEEYIAAKKEKAELEADMIAKKKASTSEFVVTGDGVQVRDAPMKSGKKITSLNKGDTVKLIGSESVPKDPYVKIVYAVGDVTHTGYFSTKYLSIKGSPSAIAASSKKVKNASSASAPKTVTAKDLDPGNENPEPASDTVKNIAIVGGAVASAGVVFWLLKKYKII